MELRYGSHLHSILTIRSGEVIKVPNVDYRGSPALKFKRVRDCFEIENQKSFAALATHPNNGRMRFDSDRMKVEDGCLPLAERKINISDSHIHDDNTTLRQLKERCREKKRKLLIFLNSTVVNAAGQMSCVKREQHEDEDHDLNLPLVSLRSKISRSKKRRIDGHISETSQSAFPVFKDEKLSENEASQSCDGLLTVDEKVEDCCTNGLCSLNIICSADNNSAASTEVAGSNVVVLRETCEPATGCDAESGSPVASEESQNCITEDILIENVYPNEQKSGSISRPLSREMLPIPNGPSGQTMILSASHSSVDTTEPGVTARVCLDDMSVAGNGSIADSRGPCSFREELQSCNPNKNLYECLDPDKHQSSSNTTASNSEVVPVLNDADSKTMICSANNCSIICNELAGSSEFVLNETHEAANGFVPESGEPNTLREESQSCIANELVSKYLNCNELNSSSTSKAMSKEMVLGLGDPDSSSMITSGDYFSAVCNELADSSDLVLDETFEADGGFVLESGNLITSVAESRRCMASENLHAKHNICSNNGDKCEQMLSDPNDIESSNLISSVDNCPVRCNELQGFSELVLDETCNGANGFVQESGELTTSQVESKRCMASETLHEHVDHGEYSICSSKMVPSPNNLDSSNAMSSCDNSVICSALPGFSELVLDETHEARNGFFPESEELNTWKEKSQSCTFTEAVNAYVEDEHNFFSDKRVTGEEMVPGPNITESSNVMSFTDKCSINPNKLLGSPELVSGERYEATNSSVIESGEPTSCRDVSHCCILSKAVHELVDHDGLHSCSDNKATSIEIVPSLNDPDSSTMKGSANDCSAYCILQQDSSDIGVDETLKAANGLIPTSRAPISREEMQSCITNKNLQESVDRDEFDSSSSNTASREVMLPVDSEVTVHHSLSFLATRDSYDCVNHDKHDSYCATGAASSDIKNISSTNMTSHLSLPLPTLDLKGECITHPPNNCIDESLSSSNECSEVSCDKNINAGMQVANMMATRYKQEGNKYNCGRGESVDQRRKRNALLPNLETGSSDCLSVPEAVNDDHCSSPSSSLAFTMEYVSPPVEGKQSLESFNYVAPMNCSDSKGSWDLDADYEVKESQLTVQNPPKRLLSARKAISPSTRERLCQAVESSNLHGNRKYYKSTGKLLLQRINGDHVSSAGSVLKASENINYGEQISELEDTYDFEQIDRDQKIDKNGYPSHLKGIPKVLSYRSLPRLSTGSTSIQDFQHSAIRFSKMQMQDIESFATKLTKEMISMKEILEKKFHSVAKSSTSLKETVNEVQAALKNATKVEKNAKRWVSIMSRNCTRFCKIMKIAEKGGVDPGDIVLKKRKISFADEAGGELCQVKAFKELHVTASPPPLDSQGEN